MGIVITTKSIPGLRECCNKARTLPCSYASELVMRLHHYFYGSTVDIKEEYRKYYASEYPNVESFLYHKYVSSQQDLRKLREALNTDCRVLLVRRSWNRDWQIYSMLEYCEMLGVIIEVLNAEWAEENDEDSI
jgi:hypothetical protein